MEGLFVLCIFLIIYITLSYSALLLSLIIWHAFGIKKGKLN